MKEFLAEVTQKGNTYTVSVSLECNTLQEAQKYLDKEYDEIIKLVEAEGHHVCKYCYAIVKGDYEDLLCDECKELFGHSLYSEL